MSRRTFSDSLNNGGRVDATIKVTDREVIVRCGGACLHVQTHVDGLEIVKVFKRGGDVAHIGFFNDPTRTYGESVWALFAALTKG